MIIDTTELDDKECVAIVLELLRDRIQIDTAFVQDFASGILTHQVLILRCGDEETASSPEPLSTPLVPALRATTIQ